MPTLAINGHSIYYEWRSAPDKAGPVLVFLHDGLGSCGSWRTVPEHLAQRLGARTLAFDRWGYGRSDERPDFPFGFMQEEVEPLRLLLDALGVERPHLIGHSDGGSIALLFASRYPQRVAAVVTEAAHVFVEPRTQQGIRALVDLQRQGATPGWLKKLHGERAERLLSGWSAGWLTPEHARWNITSALPGVRCPLLVIQGDRDEFGTLAQVRAIQAGVPHALSWVVPGSGHTPHSEAQSEFEERVAGFLAGQITFPPGSRKGG